MLRHGANMDAGPLSLVAQGAQARPGARVPASGCQTPQPKGKASPRPGGDVSSSSEYPHLQNTAISSPHPSSDLEKRGASAGSCVDARGRRGAPSRLPGRRGTGSEEPSSAPKPSRTRLSSIKLHTPSPLSSHTSAAFGLLGKQISSKGQKALFFFFFNLPVQPGAMESANQAGRRVGRLLLGEKNIFVGDCLVGNIWGNDGAFVAAVTFL